MFFVSLLVWAVTTVAFELIRPKPKFEDARPAGLGDFNFPTATEGRPVPLVWGRVKLKGPNLIWYGNFRKQAVSEEISTGLFSSDTVTTAHRYYIGMQFALCLGQVDALHGVWVNEKQVYDGDLLHEGQASIVETELFGGEEHGQGGLFGTITFYDGRSDQSADPYIASQQSPSTAYRGTCYAVWEVDPTLSLFAVPGLDWIRNNLQSPYAGWLGNSTNLYPWAFEVSRIPDGLNMASADAGAEEPNPGDANPINVLYEILTNTDWGLSIPSSDIDVTNFQEAASTLADESNGFSMVLDSETEITELISELQRQFDGSLYFDRPQGQWRIRLARGGYDVETLPVLNENTVADLKEFTRQTWEETTNQVRVAFVDREDNYKDTFALAQDPANMDIQGQTVQADVRYPGVKSAGLANQLAWRDLKALSYPLAKCRLTVNRTSWQLAPGSLFRLDWDRLGLSSVVMRVMKINYGNPSESIITIDAVQDIFAAETAVYGDPLGTGWAEPTVDPEAPTVGESLIFEAPRQMVQQDPWNPSRQIRIWMGAQDPGGGTMLLQSYIRAGSSQPLTNDYAADAMVPAFMPTGTLVSGLAAYGSSSARPDTSYTIDVNVESGGLDRIVVDGDSQLVSSLASIAYIDGEFIGYEQAADLGGGTYRLSRLHRGLFNSAPKDHDASTRVWFISQGGNLSRLLIYSDQDEADVQLRGVSPNGTETDEATTPELDIHIDRIYYAPLAPRDPYLNDVYADQTVGLDVQYTAETGLTGEDARALKVQVSARDWNIADPVADADVGAIWDQESPEFDIQLTLDPDIVVGPYTIDDLSETPTAYVLRNDVILAVGANASIPTTGLISVTARHTYNATVYTCPVDMELDLTDISSSLQGSDDLTHGAVDDGTSPNVVEYGETGSYSFDIGSPLPSSGVLEGRINGGSWETIISAGNSTGPLAVNSGDDVELRWQTGAPPTGGQFVDITGPTAERGYGVLTP